MSFFISTLSFTVFGFAYMKLRSLIGVNNIHHKEYDIVHQTKIFFQVCYEIGINFQKIVNHISTVIGTWLLVTDSEFQDNFNKIAYEEKYNDIFDNFMDTYPVSESKDYNITTSSILVEYTPIGNVVMHYDEQDKSLVYYANRSLTTRQLQSVGRKFIVHFCCPQIIEEMRLEKEEKPKTPEKENADTENKDDKPKHGLASKSGVMAKFKSNIKEEKTDTNTNKKSTDNSTPEPKPVNKVDFLKFLRKGSLADFSFTQKIKLTRRIMQPIFDTVDEATDTVANTHVNLSQQLTDINKQNLSFSEYKRLMKMKQEITDDCQETITSS